MYSKELACSLSLQELPSGHLAVEMVSGTCRALSVDSEAATLCRRGAEAAVMKKPLTAPRPQDVYICEDVCYGGIPTKEFSLCSPVERFDLGTEGSNAVKVIYNTARVLHSLGLTSVGTKNTATLFVGLVLEGSVKG